MYFWDVNFKLDTRYMIKLNNTKTRQIYFKELTTACHYLWHRARSIHTFLCRLDTGTNTTKCFTTQQHYKTVDVVLESPYLSPQRRDFCFLPPPPPTIPGIRNFCLDIATPYIQIFSGTTHCDKMICPYLFIAIIVGRDQSHDLKFLTI